MSLAGTNRYQSITRAEALPGLQEGRPAIFRHESGNCHWRLRTSCARRGLAGNAPGACFCGPIAEGREPSGEGLFPGVTPVVISGLPKGRRTRSSGQCPDLTRVKSDKKAKGYRPDQTCKFPTPAAPASPLVALPVAGSSGIKQACTAWYRSGLPVKTRATGRRSSSSSGHQPPP